MNEEEDDSALVEEAEEALEMTKTALMLNPKLQFFSEVVLNLEHKISTEVSTACTDGYTCLYNPRFFLEQSEGMFGERVGLVLHEVNHPAFHHFARQESRNESTWNMAGDHEINLIIKEQNIALPEGGLCDDKYKNWTAEEIYEDLDQDQEPEDQQPDSGLGGDLVKPGSLTPGKEGTSPEEAVAHIDDILATAAIRAEANGYGNQVPRHISTHIERLKNPVVPWLRVLRAQLSVLTRSGYSYRSHNRRYLPEFHLPRFASESLDEILIGHDTSISITTPQYKADLAEMFGLIKRCKPKKVNYVQWGQEVVDTHVLKKAADINDIELVSGGGTLPQCLLDWAIENTKTKLALIFTDGQFDPNKLTEPPFKVIWVVYDNPDWIQPFGKKVTYTRKQHE